MTLAPPFPARIGAAALAAARADLCHSAAPATDAGADAAPDLARARAAWSLLKAARGQHVDLGRAGPPHHRIGTPAPAPLPARGAPVPAITSLAAHLEATWQRCLPRVRAAAARHTQCGAPTPGGAA